MAPTTTKRWHVEGTKGFDESLVLRDYEIPQLGDHEILVKMRAAALNYRDLLITMGKYPLPVGDGVVPASDGAGEVAEIGSKVSRFQKGDKVVTLHNQGHIAGSLTPKSTASVTGVSVNGTLAQYGVFDENALVELPECLSFREGASLTCTGVTAWNALYGLAGNRLTPGDTVLTQGTGGVSVFALQFALAAGAIVIATTSSEAKAEKLKSLGAHHVINYKENPNWGQTARSLTPGGLGVTHVIEVGGPSTLKQSLEAIKVDGVISIVGFLGGSKSEDNPSFLEALSRHCIVRGILVGSRLQHEEMNRAIQANKIKPAIDDKVFTFDTVKDAYKYMWGKNHFGKLAIDIQ